MKSLHTDWRKDGDRRYYLPESRAMLTGTRWSDVERYEFGTQSRQLTEKA